MPRYVALLRAMNVGGTGKLAMADLKRIGVEAGFSQVSTYIASGNLLFRSEDDEATVRAKLCEGLEGSVGKAIDVHVRTAEELADVVARNPFAAAAPNRVVAIFLDGPIAKDATQTVSGQRDEELAIGARELFVHYAAGIGESKLRIPAASRGTARNMNTVAKLAALAAAL